MSERFLKFIPSEEAFWLMDNKPNAFRLLSRIANTARRTGGSPDNLLIGQCHLQHWQKYNLTEQQYRTAKQILIQRKHIIIIETNRTRKKSTTGSTTNSTLVQLISSTVYDINAESDNDRINVRATTEQRPSNDKQEGIRNIKKEKEENIYARSDKRPRTTDSIKFNFEIYQFEGITDVDVQIWRELYPLIDLNAERKRAIEWIKSNPSKSNKSQWRRFLNNWFTTANGNAERKKMFKDTNPNNLDRRTKDIHGNPVVNQHAGKF